MIVTAVERVGMRNKGLSFLAAAALLTSVGAAYAKGPVTLTDSQLDKVTAGDAASQLAFLVGLSTLELQGLLALSSFFLNPLSILVPRNPAL
jgi:predicted small lipoprotein YifL